MRKRLIAVIGGVALVLSIGALLARACPFCSATSQTFSEELGTMDVAVIAKLVKLPPQSSKAGDELQKAGAELKEGKVYESNLGLLRGLAMYNGFEIRYTTAARDRKSDLKSKVKTLLRKSDMLLISGGVSVGKYDYVNEVLDELNVSKLFYKVSQKPGKPLYFGKKSNTAVFGLPGNPASAFTCFYLYVLPVLKKMSGHKKFLPVWKIPQREMD